MKKIRLRNITNAAALSTSELKSIIGGKVKCSVTCANGSDATLPDCDTCVSSGETLYCSKGGTLFEVTCTGGGESGNDSGSGGESGPDNNSGFILAMP